MNSAATFARSLRGLLRGHRAELSLCFRVTASAVLTLLVSQLLHLRLGLWAVLTAVLLTQMSVGRSLKATIDYFAGTLGGAIFAGAVGALIPHDSEIALAFVLAVTLVPVALVAAANTRFSAGPFTAVMVLLAPTITHLSPIASAFERVIEVAVGCIVGLVVSLLVLPARAHDLTINAAGRVLSLMAQELPRLLGGLTRKEIEATARRVGEEVAEAYASAQAIAVEGMHERMPYLAATPDLQPLLRTLLRLQHDFVMIGRTAPLPTVAHARLRPVLASAGHAAATYLRASGSALVACRHAAPRQAVDAALDDCAAELAVLSQEHSARDLPGDALERMFTLAFALEQLRRNLNDLERCVAECCALADQTGPMRPRAGKWLP